MKSITTLICALFTILLFNSNTGCEDPIELNDLPSTTYGLIPVYDSGEQWKSIVFAHGKVPQRPNTKEKSNGFTYISEINSGIHVVDNTSTSGLALSFISIPKQHSTSIEGDLLFSGNFRDRLTFSIKDPHNITLVSRDEDFYPDADLLSLPVNFEGYIECPDHTLGVIVNWETAEIINPECWNF